MIHDTVFPSFYLIEAEAHAVRAFIGSRFNVKKIIVASEEFNNDIDAHVAAKTAVKFLLNGSKLNRVPSVEDIQLNPEFFPTCTPHDPADVERAAELQAAETEDTKLPPGKMMLPLTRNFDTVGDFVQARSTITGADFKITTRIAADPQRYLQEKLRTEDINRLTSAHREEKPFLLQ